MSWNDTARRIILKVFPRAGAAKRRLSWGSDSTRLRAQVRRLTLRVTELENEVQEARRLNLRVAELTDVVAEVLLPVDERNDERIRERLAAYVRTF